MAFHPGSSGEESRCPSAEVRWSSVLASFLFCSDFFLQRGPQWSSSALAAGIPTAVFGFCSGHSSVQMEALSPTPPQVHPELEDTDFLTWDSLHSVHIDWEQRARKQAMDALLEYS